MSGAGKDSVPTSSPPLSLTESSNTPPSQAQLLARIADLESQLRTQTARLSAAVALSKAPSTSSGRERGRARDAPPRPFNAALYSSRQIALKFSYLGGRYNGYEHANGSVPPKPTIEEVLWKTLRKARLISPAVAEGADASFDVVWDTAERSEKYVAGRGGGGSGGDELDQMRLELNWDGCQYSKCGRTDRGVSAFGQVVGVRVRSSRPLEKSGSGQDGMQDRRDSSSSVDSGVDDAMQDLDVADFSDDVYYPPFDPIKDELPYISILNSILPADIRILAWCPDPPVDFDARFSCRERRYRYFFTNPAFCPTPGAIGPKTANEGHVAPTDGWLDIAQMRQAAKKLEGLHDFRNLCKIDASKQMSSCERRITFADVEEVDGGLAVFGSQSDIDPPGGRAAANGMLKTNSASSCDPASGPKVYAFVVHGSAFLWHQVRCMVAVLFLVGQGLEPSSIVDELLDIDRNPGRPTYVMADDAPLVLWDCVFPDTVSNGEDALNWIHAGDEPRLPSSITRRDDKFGLGGVVDAVWSQWRKAKMEEVLTGSLLGLALGQGGGRAFQWGGVGDPANVGSRSQKVFEGGDSARLVGKYVPMMEKPRMDSLLAQNEKYMAGKGAKRWARLAEEANGGD